MGAPLASAPRLDLLTVALADYGVTEMPGSGTAPEILAMAKDLGVELPAGDETPWCGLAMAAWVTRAGGAPPRGFLSARNWLTVGEQVLVPERGDIAVLWRGEPGAWQGHVGLFVAQRGVLLFLLGGNQGNTVTITPHRVERLLGYRRLYAPRSQTT